MTFGTGSIGGDEFRSAMSVPPEENIRGLQLQVPANCELFAAGRNNDGRSGLANRIIVGSQRQKVDQEFLDFVPVQRRHFQIERPASQDDFDRLAGIDKRFGNSLSDEGCQKPGTVWRGHECLSFPNGQRPIMSVMFNSGLRKSMGIRGNRRPAC
jgi:hypothetical protein